MPYVGSSLRRVEDPRLVAGQGRYVDDLNPPGALHAAFVRSPYAQARVRRVATGAAVGLPGVVGVFTAKDLAGVVPAPPRTMGRDTRVAAQPPLCAEMVHLVGDAVAVVVATDRYQAADAAEAVEVEYEPLPGISGIEQALAPGAPLVHPEMGTNLAFSVGQEQGDVDAAFTAAAHVVRLRVANNRVAAAPLEPRTVLASYDAVLGELTVWLSTQSVFRARGALAAALGMPEPRLRVVALDVGGGFGVKTPTYREDIVVAWAARRLGRPVKWVSTRAEDLATTQQAREQVDEIEAAVDAQGRVTALRLTATFNLGAYLSGGGVAPVGRTMVSATGLYAIPAVSVQARGVYTNTASTGAYRGAGRPEAAMCIERVMDEAAGALGMDPAEVRRRNFVRTFPYHTATGIVVDSGDYLGTLDVALRLAGYEGLRREQRERRARGELVGIGFSTYLELSAGPGHESGSVRVDPGGTVTATVGSIPQGQGHDTSMAQIVADAVGVRHQDVIMRHGDTAAGPPGVGTFASRSTALGGSALWRAGQRVREKALRIAAHLLEADAADVELTESVARVRGAPQRQATLRQVAAVAYGDLPGPPGLEPGLEATDFFKPEGDAFSYGAYLAMVSIDRDTGALHVERLIVVDDCGHVINPMLVEGQIHGSLAQGIGQALWEHVVYDEQGQLASGTLMDYAVARARQLPPWVIERTETPSPRNPLGVKGVGEAGTIGAPPALVNAAVDALAPLGVRHLDMPLTAEKLWRIIHSSDG